MESEIIGKLAEGGPFAIILGLLIWFLMNQIKTSQERNDARYQQMQSQLLEIVKQNTTAYTEMGNAIRMLESKLEKLSGDK